MIRTLTAFALSVAVAGGPTLAADPATGPRLSVASNLSQGRQPGVLSLSQSLGVVDFRDGMNWGRAEPRPGQYVFNDARTGFARDLQGIDATASIVLNFGNPNYDGGSTPHSAAAVSAFGAFAAEVLKTFPNVDSLEIGNEFNGRNFVRGPIRDMTPADRARAYVPMLKAAADAARAVRPDIRISGGATHSMAGGYLWQVMDAGGAGLMDALAIHPYTTPAEHFVRQAAVIRRHPDANLPIEVTEFGSPDPDRAADHFLRNYCQFALGGVTRAAWYPLNERGDSMVPLFQPDGRITPAGRAYRLIAARMEGRPVTDAAPDAFSYGCQFGGDTLVLWGTPRPVDITGDVSVSDSSGQPLAPPYRLDEDRVLVIQSETGPVADQVTVAPSGLLAHSFHQFAYPEDTELRASGDGFERYVRVGSKTFPLITLPGQEKQGAPWYPYRGNPDLGKVRLTAASLLPGGRRDRPIEVVQAYIAPARQTADLTATFAPASRSEDGITVIVTLDGEEVFAETSSSAIRVDLAGLEMDEGARLELAVGPNGSSKGDVTRYRIVLRDSAAR